MSFSTVCFRTTGVYTTSKLEWSRQGLSRSDIILSTPSLNSSLSSRVSLIPTTLPKGDNPKYMFPPLPAIGIKKTMYIPAFLYTCKDHLKFSVSCFRWIINKSSFTIINTYKCTCTVIYHLMRLNIYFIKKILPLLSIPQTCWTTVLAEIVETDLLGLSSLVELFWIGTTESVMEMNTCTWQDLFVKYLNAYMQGLK